MHRFFKNFIGIFRSSPRQSNNRFSDSPTLNPRISLEKKRIFFFLVKGGESLIFVRVKLNITLYLGKITFY